MVYPVNQHGKIEVGKVKGRKIAEQKRVEGESDSEESSIPPRKGSAATHTSKPGEMVTITVGGRRNSGEEITSLRLLRPL
jgi:hypothetical protein